MGEYTFELQVTDHYGAAAPSELCPGQSVRLRARAKPDEALHVQLTWDTPLDDDQTDDFGTDVDLHLLHPAAEQWTTQNALSCNYTNRHPDWGHPNDLNDDPSLDIDDVNGAGPENINIKEPENTSEFGRGYRIGAHYFSAGLGGQVDVDAESHVTVRIYLEGILTQEVRKTLTETDDLWSVGEVTFNDDGGSFSPDGAMTQMRP